MKQGICKINSAQLRTINSSIEHLVGGNVKFGQSRAEELQETVVMTAASS